MHLILILCFLAIRLFEVRGRRSKSQLRKATEHPVNLSLKSVFNDFRFRVFCHWLCNHSYFGNIILVCILVSSALLAAEDPLGEKESARTQVSFSFVFLKILDLLFFSQLCELSSY